MKRNLMPHRPWMLSAVALALLAWNPAHADEPAAAPDPDKAAKEEGVKLDSIVITGTATLGSKMKQSVSVSSLDTEEIAHSGASSAADVLRNIPGIHAEASGGEGNANITVRGVPISAGGSRYVQFQEDGLPVLLFGDIAFGTADEFTRVDFMLDRVEALRGGSASTMASNSPGGLINFISKTGKTRGGDAAVTLDLDHRGERLDFDFGTPLGNGLSMQVGGFQRSGDGARPANMQTENGGQLRANLTQSFDDGFVRLSLKHLDDRTPSYMPVPVQVQGGTVHTLPGIDPRTAYFLSPNLPTDTTLDRNGNTVTSNTSDGLHTVTNAVGVEAQLKLAGDWLISEKFRRADNSGRFIALYPQDNGNNGTTPFDAALFNTSIDDLNNQFNDLRASKQFALDGAGRVTLTAGLFTGTQDVGLTWYWNTYRIQSVGTGAQVYNAAGQTSTQPINNAFGTFGGCCVRTFDVQYNQFAPYLNLGYANGPWTLDASVRDDDQRATGWYESGNAATQAGWDPATRKIVDYKVSHTSYSVGANYQLSHDLALFARASDGVAFSADRLLYGNPLDGSVPVAVNEVKQVEGGSKWRSGPLSTFVTLFEAHTDESNYDLTRQQFSANSYKAYGAELEASVALGPWHLSAGGTLTHSRITASASTPAIVGNTPQRLASFIYQLSPRYDAGNWEAGAAIVGTTSSPGDDANTTTMPGYTVVNAFFTYHANDKLDLSLNVNNLFNTIGYTEFDNVGNGTATAARSINGRTAKLMARYSF